jgi:glucose-6-phosphate 1-dehydrogenase
MVGSIFYIFGATGDLAKRKLFPAIYNLYLDGKLDEHFAVVGLARRARLDDEFRSDVKQSIQQFARRKMVDEQKWMQFANHFYYMSLDIHNLSGFETLHELTNQLELTYLTQGNRMFYLALAPELFGEVSYHLKKSKMLETKGWHRLVIEKPFGYDLESAEHLNKQLREVFAEKDIFRIDHYLGKEMVQNIEFVRFANTILEPLWNHKYIANIQFTVSETVGVEDRGASYDQSGALRDMGQNHLMQMLMMMAIEPPVHLNAAGIRNEKMKVLHALRLHQSHQDVHENVVRAQYAEGHVHGKTLPSYVSEPSVASHSKTETFFASRIFIDNDRWKGVPFYLRTGKRMAAKTTEIVVEFKNIPNTIYLAQKHQLSPNLLVIRINPMEGIYLKMNAKQPGSDGVITPIAMDFCQSCQIGYNTPEAYERLIFDALRGDSTYFTGWDEVSLAWTYVDRILKVWSENTSDLTQYSVGTWGPVESMELLAKDGFHWWPVSGQNEGEIEWAAVPSLG